MTIIYNDGEVIENMKDYFVSITDSIGITESTRVNIHTECVSDPIEWV